MKHIHRVACIQMSSSGDISENLLAAHQFIQEAAEEGAKLIVLPEMFALMGIDQKDKIKYRERLGEGPIQEFLSQQAAEFDVWIVGGTLPIQAEQPDKVYASCFVYNNEGNAVARYDKIHLFDVQLRATKESFLESKTVQPGGQIVVVDTPFGRLGLGICYDVRFPEMFRLMAAQGMDIIALPAAFTYVTGAAHWDVLVRARAIENLSFVLSACQVGMHANQRKTYGHSMIVNPWGEVQVCLPDNPGVVLSEINLEFLRQIREEFPVLSHRRY